MTYCAYKNCQVRATYGYKDRPGSLSCGKHKTDEMIIKYVNKCLDPDCTTRASHALPGESARYCSQHKLEGMTYKYKQCCEEEGCETTACYGERGTKKKRFCAKHKKPGMEMLSAKKCQHEGGECKTGAAFGYPGTNERTHCGLHKLPGMVSLSKYRHAQKMKAKVAKNADANGEVQGDDAPAKKSRKRSLPALSPSGGESIQHMPEYNAGGYPVEVPAQQYQGYQGESIDMSIGSRALEEGDAVMLPRPIPPSSGKRRRRVVNDGDDEEDDGSSYIFSPPKNANTVGQGNATQAPTSYWGNTTPAISYWGCPDSPSAAYGSALQSQDTGIGANAGSRIRDDVDGSAMVEGGGSDAAAPEEGGSRGVYPSLMSAGYNRVGDVYGSGGRNAFLTQQYQGDITDKREGDRDDQLPQQTTSTTKRRRRTTDDAGEDDDGTSYVFSPPKNARVRGGNGQGGATQAPARDWGCQDQDIPPGSHMDIDSSATVEGPYGDAAVLGQGGPPGVYPPLMNTGFMAKGCCII